MDNLKELKDAAKATTAEVLKQFDQMDTRQFKDLTSELRKNSVDNETIAELESIINDATRKNERLTAFIKRSGAIGEVLVKTACSIVKK